MLELGGGGRAGRVLGGPARELGCPGPERGQGERAGDGQADAAWGAEPAGRAGRRAPAQSTRAAFSAMSPPAGQMTTGQPLVSARTRVPWPPWRDDEVAGGHRLRVGQPGNEHGVGRRRGSGGDGSRPFQVAITRTGSRGQAGQRGAQQPVLGVLGGGGRDQHDRAVARAAGRRARPAAPTSAGRRRAARTASRAGTRARGAWPRASARATGPCGRTAAAAGRAGRGTRCSRAGPARARSPRAGPQARQNARPDRRPGQPRADRVRREARRQVRMDVGDQRGERARPRARRPARARG